MWRQYCDTAASQWLLPRCRIVNKGQRRTRASVFFCFFCFFFSFLAHGCSKKKKDTLCLAKTPFVFFPFRSPPPPCCTKGTFLFIFLFTCSGTAEGEISLSVLSWDDRRWGAGRGSGEVMIDAQRGKTLQGFSFKKKKKRIRKKRRVQGSSTQQILNTFLKILKLIKK